MSGERKSPLHAARFDCTKKGMRLDPGGGWVRVEVAEIAVRQRDALEKSGHCFIREVAVVLRGELGADWADSHSVLFERMEDFRDALAKLETKG